jgi:hypothetical protein
VYLTYPDGSSRDLQPLIPTSGACERGVAVLLHVEIPEGHWDEYRLEVCSATPRLVYSRVIASQGYWKE